MDESRRQDEQTASENSEATSTDTLSDLEENEKQVESSDSNPSPSPDGAFDESDERNDAGPM